MAKSVLRSPPSSELRPRLPLVARVGDVEALDAEAADGLFPAALEPDAGVEFEVAEAVAALSRSRPRERACSPSDMRELGLIAAGPAVEPTALTSFWLAPAGKGLAPELPSALATLVGTKVGPFGFEWSTERRTDQSSSAQRQVAIRTSLNCSLGGWGIVIVCEGGKTNWGGAGVGCRWVSHLPRESKLIS